MDTTINSIAFRLFDEEEPDIPDLYVYTQPGGVYLAAGTVIHAEKLPGLN